MCDFYENITAKKAWEIFPEALCFCTGGTHLSPSLTMKACQKSVFTQMVCVHPGLYMNAVKLAEYQDFVCPVMNGST